MIDLVQSAIRHLESLIALDTVSRKSNLVLINHVIEFLLALGADVRLIENQGRQKANLIATLGPGVSGGVVLSGHTDIRPVDGHGWSGDPLQLVERNGRLFGRGAAGIKAFLACSLAAAPFFVFPGRLCRPVVLAFSYDEELGCPGASAVIDTIASKGPAPAAVVVGEPTRMQAVGTHKGVLGYDVTILGREAHSSLTPLGLSANSVAVHLMSCLMSIAKELEIKSPTTPFEPMYSTLTIGKITSGTADTILSGRCDFSFDLRFIPETDPEHILVPFHYEMERLNLEMRRQYHDAGIEAVRRISVPAFAPERSHAAELVRRLTDDNSLPRALPFASQAGRYQAAGLSTIICGPGSIEQAHKSNEFIDRDQLDKCMKFMLRLSEYLSE